MTRCCLAVMLCLAFAPAALAQGKPGDPIKLTVTPAKAPARLLKYQFQFELSGQHEGNAATDYKEAGRLYKEARGSEAEAFGSQEGVTAGCAMVSGIGSAGVGCGVIGAC